MVLKDVEVLFQSGRRSRYVGQRKSKQHHVLGSANLGTVVEQAKLDCQPSMTCYYRESGSAHPLTTL